MKAIAIICNIFFPGVGSLIIGKVGEGIGQLILYIIGMILTLTAIGAIIGIPLMLGAWIWGIVTAAGSSSQPVQVTVIQNGGSNQEIK